MIGAHRSNNCEKSRLVIEELLLFICGKRAEIAGYIAFVIHDMREASFFHHICDLFR